MLPPHLFRALATTTPRRVEVADIFVFAMLTGIATLLALNVSHPGHAANSEISLSYSALPAYALYSFLRMLAAYVLSLLFTLVYGKVATNNQAAERVLVPLLDVLQSIPILSFLPGVVLALVALFPGSRIGLELSAIILIFTSQCWNITFSFYSSLRTLPQELREAASIYRLNSWRVFTTLEVPASMIGLVWNSMMGWAGGWFFLIASEQFTLGDKNFQLPGLGSYLQKAASEGNTPALLAGLSALIAVIVLLDQFIWRPLIVWSDKFKVEQTPGQSENRSRVLEFLQRSVLLQLLITALIAPLARRFDRLAYRLAGSTAHTATSPTSPGQRATGLLLRGIFGVGGLALALFGIWQGGRLVLSVSLSQWGAIWIGAGATLLRVLLALLIGVAWTVPAGVAIGLSPVWSKRMQSLVQVIASVPATALFPVLLVLLLQVQGGLSAAAILLMLLGTQWYILFNVIAGAMAIPTDLKEASVVYHLRGWRRWRTLILPAIFPFLITGMVTATGGAWNASIVSEYVQFGNKTVTTTGLGALISSAAAANNGALLLSSTLVMSLVVVTFNRFLWRRLYRLAEDRYRAS